MSSPQFIHYLTPEQGFLKKTLPQKAKHSLPIIDSTNGNRNPLGEHQAYQNEAVCSLSLRSFQQPADLAQHPIDHSAPFPLSSGRPDDDSSQNNHSVQRRRLNRPNSRKKAKQGMLGALAEFTAQERTHTSRTVQSGATGDFQSVRKIRTLQVQNASLRRQLGHVSERFLCPLCPNSYTRNDRLYDHIVHKKEEYHQRVAAKLLEPRCLACGQKFKRITEVVKHELNVCKMDYKSRAEPAFASLFRGTTSDDNYQPHRLIHPTNKVQVLNTLELENATSSAHLDSAPSISSLNICAAGGSSAEQGGLNDFLNDVAEQSNFSNGFSNGLGEQTSSSKEFSNWQGEHYCLPDGVVGQNSNGFSNLQGEPNAFPNSVAGVAGQNSNGFSNVQGEPNAFPNGAAGVAGQHRFLRPEVSQTWFACTYSN